MITTTIVCLTVLAVFWIVAKVGLTINYTYTHRTPHVDESPAKDSVLQEDEDVKGTKVEEAAFSPDDICVAIQDMLGGDFDD